jgi:hypothetical protein
MSKIFAGEHRLSEPAKAMVDYMDELTKLWDNAFVAAAKNNRTEVSETSSESKYSFAGRKALTADSQSLSQAEKLEKQGMESEEIRQATGWFRGYDGQWRFEIDDSGMEYTSRGDLNFKNSNPDYARYRELVSKAEKFMLGMSNENLTEAENKEMLQLRETWGATFQAGGKLSADANTQTKLSSYLKHDELFNAYPELKDTRLEFKALPEKSKGSYNSNTDTITLNESLRNSPEKTLLHEIQHIIQTTEGFAKGANIENGREQYVKSAGEIEARDTANRSNLSSEQRKNTRPDIDQTGVVVNGNGSGWVNDLIEKGNVSYSLREFEDGVRFVNVDIRQEPFDKLTLDEQISLAKEIIKKYFSGRIVGTDNKIFVNSSAAKECTHPVKNLDDSTKSAKMRASTELDNLFDAGGNQRTASDGADGHKHKDAVGGFTYYDVIFKVGNQYYSGVINVVNNKKGRLLKDITKIRNVTKDIIGSYGETPKSEFLRDTSVDSILNSNKNVNTSFGENEPKFSLRDNVEESKDLIAVHNLNESKLMSALKLGGFPMPSIAIVKANSGHSKYGNISVVFRKGTIDPKASRKNKVYSGDAWTPMYPQIEYKVNSKAQEKIRDKYYELAREFGYDAARPLYNYVYDLDSKLSNSQGESGLLAGLYDNTDIMQLFLLDSGSKMIEPVQKEIVKEMSDSDVAVSQYFIDSLGEDLIKSFKTPADIILKPHASLNYRKQFVADNRESILTAYRNILREQFDITDDELIEDIISDTTDSQILGWVRKAYDLLTDGKRQVAYETYKEATNAAIKAAVPKAQYRAWVDSLFKGVVEKEGIRNQKDEFTPAGNRRSFESLHYENNLENVVEAMREQGEKGITHFGNRSIMGASVKSYGSISEMKKSQQRFGTMDEDQYDEMRKSFDNRFIDISLKFVKDVSNFTAVNDCQDMLVEAVATGKSKSAIENYIKTEGKGWTIYSQSAVDDLLQLVQDIQNMPTEYFEAKPQRAVGFDEIAAVVLPSDSSAELKTQLKDNGIETLEYADGDEAQRLAQLNSIENVRFQMRDNTSGMTKEEISSMERSYSRLKTENAENERKWRYWKGQTELTKQQTVRESDVRKFARTLVNKYDSTIDVNELAEQLQRMGNMLVQKSGEELSYTELRDMAYDIGRSIVESAEVPQLTGYEDIADEIVSSIKAAKFKVASYKNLPEGFRKEYRGKLHIDRQYSRSADSYYQEWQEQYGYDLFPEDIVNPDDQLVIIADAYDFLTSTQTVNPFASNKNEMSIAISNEILDTMLSEEIRQTAPTKADKAAAKLANQKATDRARLDDLRNEKNARIDKVERNEAEKRKEVRAKEKAAKWEAVAAVKEHYEQMIRESNETRRENAEV